MPPLGHSRQTGMSAPPRETKRVMSRILVAVSSPWASERAAEPIADLARRLGAEVLVVHVSRPSGGQLREQEQADGESAIRLLRDRLLEKNVPVQDLLTFSDD